MLKKNDKNKSIRNAAAADDEGLNFGEDGVICGFQQSKRFHCKCFGNLYTVWEENACFMSQMSQ